MWNQREIHQMKVFFFLCQRLPLTALSHPPTPAHPHCICGIPSPTTAAEGEKKHLSGGQLAPLLARTHAQAAFCTRWSGWKRFWFDSTRLKKERPTAFFSTKHPDPHSYKLGAYPSQHAHQRPRALPSQAGRAAGIFVLAQSSCGGLCLRGIFLIDGKPPRLLNHSCQKSEKTCTKKSSVVTGSNREPKLQQF